MCFLLQDGEILQVGVKHRIGNRYWLDVEGVQHEVLLVSENGNLEVFFPHRSLGVEIGCGRAGSGAGHQQALGRHEVVSSMPGRVIEILVSVGDEVQKNQEVIIVEAMKMQNELKSRIQGQVAAIHVSQGDTVESGAALLVIE